MNYKPRHNMAAKSRPKTTEEQEGMASLLAKLRELRQQATKAQHEDVKNVEGVGYTHPGVL